jgi:hypothetical protein
MSHEWKIRRFFQICTQRNNHVKFTKKICELKIHANFVNFHKILLKFIKIRMDFQLKFFFGEFYMIISLS